MDCREEAPLETEPSFGDSCSDTVRDTGGLNQADGVGPPTHADGKCLRKDCNPILRARLDPK